MMHSLKWNEIEMNSMGNKFYFWSLSILYCQNGGYFEMEN